MLGMGTAQIPRNEPFPYFLGRGSFSIGIQYKEKTYEVVCWC